MAQIEKIQSELTKIKLELDKYAKLFKADGIIDSDEQKKLDKMNALIKKAEHKIEELQQGEKGQSGEAGMANITLLEQIIRGLEKHFGIKDKTFQEPTKILEIVKAKLKDTNSKFTELDLFKLTQSLLKLNDQELAQIGNRDNIKLPPYIHPIITKYLCQVWGEPNLRKELLKLIKPAYENMKAIVDGIENAIKALPKGEEILIKPLQQLVSDKGGGHSFSQTFLLNSKGTNKDAIKAEATQYMSVKCKGYNVPERIKLAKKVQKFRKILSDKGRLYIETRNDAKNMGGNALELLEKFFAQAGVENMAEWVTGYADSKVNKLDILIGVLTTFKPKTK